MPSELTQRSVRIRVEVPSESIQRNARTRVEVPSESIQRNASIRVDPIDLDRRRLLAAGAATGGLMAIAGGHVALAQSRPTSINPFKVAVPQAKLDWVRRRLQEAKWPTTVRGSGWKYGPDVDSLRALVDYWSTRYDWRAQEAHINRLPQFMADVAGRQLHFVHMRSANPKAVPLLLLHGWPNTFYSFDKVVEPLAEQGSHIVVPSLPGFAFSQTCDDQVRGARFISERIYRLMTEVLGYSRFIVAGGDWGAVIADWLAVDHPEAVIAEYANVFALGNQKPASGATPEETAFFEQQAAIGRRESAYFLLQATRMESIAYAMTDSPLGTAAYLVDKWQKWSDTRARSMEDSIGRDHLLTEIMLYIVTNAFATSTWIYPGFMLENTALPAGRKITVPYGFAAYPDPVVLTPPRSLVERSRNLVSWETQPAGGHFPYLENPSAYVEGLLSFTKRFSQKQAASP